MSICVTDLHLNVLNMRTRMPFRYGIATLTRVPHLFVRIELEVEGQRQAGLAADHMPPKWFTKDPDTSFQDDLEVMVGTIRRACAFAREAGPVETVFDLWQRVHGAQEAWAAEAGLPPLLWGFGVSLVERAAIDAYCRATSTPFAQAVRAGELGIRLGAIHAELGDTTPADWLPPLPLGSLNVRHTVGLGDPLTDAEINEEDRARDGLPQSLQASIAAHGLSYFKIKVNNNLDADLDRLRRIAKLFESMGMHNYSFTLDGNEQYDSFDAFRLFWQRLEEDATLEPFLGRLLFVEQPLHRDIALSDPAGESLLAWPLRPPIIIDESGGALDSLPRALDLGYCGTSHKNCKGVFKGIANACLIAQRRLKEPTKRFILSGEDLSNVGPVALQQDLAVLAALGINHAERNGHHYFAGLSALPDDMQAEMLAAHGDFYRTHSDAEHDRSFAIVDIENGQLSLRSIAASNFGVQPLLDTGRFTPLDDWTFDSLG